MKEFHVKRWVYAMQSQVVTAKNEDAAKALAFGHEWKDCKEWGDWRVLHVFRDEAKELDDE